MFGHTKREQIWVTTLYGQANRIPLVQIEVPNGKVQLSIDAAEDMARNIVHACEASLTDAFLIEFLKGSLKLDDPAVFGVIREFRQWREARIATPPEPDEETS